jgi:hypothetical protein
MENKKLILVSFALFLVIAYISWSIGRYVNYKLSYEDMVKQTIQEMVRKEALK